MVSRTPLKSSRPVKFILVTGVVFAIIGFIQLILFLGGFVLTSEIGGLFIPLIGIVMIVMGLQLTLMAGKIRRI